MTTRQSFDTTVPMNTIAEKGRNNEGAVVKKKISAKDFISIRKKPLYKGQLSYIKDILLADNPEISADIVSERLDVPTETAKLLLNDCKTHFKDNED